MPTPTITLAAPNATAFMIISTGFGTYTSDINGLIYAVPIGQALTALQTAGCTVASPGQIAQAGGGISGFRGTGNVLVTISAAGQGNSADLTDDVLAFYAMSPNAFDVAGRELLINAAGKFAANGNNKRVKVWATPTLPVLGSAVAGGVLLADSGVVTNNGQGWTASTNITKYGAAGSNTQMAWGSQVITGATHGGTTAPALLTQAEAATIYFAITGSSPTTGAAGDVLLNALAVQFSN